MKTETIIRQMEEFVQNFRAQIEKNDPASLAVLTSNMERFFNELKDDLPEDAHVAEQVHSFQSCVERFGKACENNNMEEASQALADMEATLKGLQKQYGPEYAL